MELLQVYRTEHFLDLTPDLARFFPDSLSIRCSRMTNNIPKFDSTRLFLKGYLKSK